MDSYTEFGWFPCSVACEDSVVDVCNGRWLPVVATFYKGATRRKSATTRQASKTRGCGGAAITHWTWDLWPLHLLHQMPTDIPGTDTPGEMQYTWSSRTGANLKIGIPIPYLRSYTLSTCARKSVVGTSYVPSVSRSEKKSCKVAAKTSDDGAKRRPISRHSGDSD